MECKLAVQKQYWIDVRNQVKSIAPALAQIIDQIDPGQDYPLYRVKYPFGFKVLKDGQFSLPDVNGQPIKLSDGNVPSELQEALSYNAYHNPVGLAINKGLEIFTNFAGYAIPFHVFYPGDLFGLANLLDLQQNDQSLQTEPAIWNMTSGTRSCFMAPKISRASSHNKLKKHFSIHADAPKTLSDHWKVFTEVYQGAVEHHKADSWQSEVLLFSKNWFTQHHDDPTWQSLWLYLYRTNRRLNAFWRNSFTWNLTFLKINKQAGVRQAQLDLTQIVKNIFSIAKGALPGFQPTQNENLLPVKTLQAAYRDIYDLPKYSPLLFQCGYFNTQNNDPFYYSPLYPIYGDFLFSDPTAQISYINLLDEVHFIINKHLDEIKPDQLSHELTTLHHIKRNVGLRIFHNLPAGNINICPSETLPQTDPHLLPDTDRKFPDNSPFLKCCIQIYNK